MIFKINQLNKRKKKECLLNFNKTQTINLILSSQKLKIRILTIKILRKTRKAEARAEIKQQRDTQLIYKN